MNCPRCGHPASEDDRFCRECGADLAPPTRSAPARPTLGQRLGRLVGRTGRERLLAAGTVVAVVVAIAAFIALPEADDDEASAYARAADPICVEAKKEIARAGDRALRASDGDVAGYAADLVRIVAAWRSDLAALEASGDERSEAAALHASLGEVLTGSAELAAAARQGEDPTAIAARLDESTVEVEESIAALGLERCAAIGLSAAPRP